MDSLEGDLDRYRYEEYGDFLVGREHWQDAAEQHSERSRTAKRVDANRRAPVTTNYRVWAANPSHWDFPGVDTPKAAPSVLPKDYATKMYQRSTTNVRTVPSPEHGSTPRPEPLSTADLADEHEQARANRLGIAPMDLEHHAGYYDERDRHWERGRSDVEDQESVPEPFRGREGRDRETEVGHWSIRGVLEARKDEEGRQFAVRDR